MAEGLVRMITRATAYVNVHLWDQTQPTSRTGLGAVLRPLDGCFVARIAAIPRPGPTSRGRGLARDWHTRRRLSGGMVGGFRSTVRARRVADAGNARRVHTPVHTSRSLSAASARRIYVPTCVRRRCEPHGSRSLEGYGGSLGQPQRGEPCGREARPGAWFAQSSCGGLSCVSSVSRLRKTVRSRSSRS